MLPTVATVTTPWGKATRLEELALPQRAGDKRFTTRVELLQTDGAERLVRFSYATSGAARRGPVTLRERDVAKLGVLLARTPELRRALQRLAEEGS